MKQVLNLAKLSSFSPTLTVSDASMFITTAQQKWSHNVSDRKIHSRNIVGFWSQWQNTWRVYYCVTYPSTNITHLWPFSNGPLKDFFFRIVSLRALIMLNPTLLGSPVCHDGTRPQRIGRIIQSQEYCLGKMSKIDDYNLITIIFFCFGYKSYIAT